MVKPQIFAKLIIGFLIIVGVLFGGLWVVGKRLVHPAQISVGSPPSDLPARTVAFLSAAGTLIREWFTRGTGRGANFFCTACAPIDSRCSTGPGFFMR